MTNVWCSETVLSIYIAITLDYNKLDYGMQECFDV